VPIAQVGVAIGLVLLVESFGRDVIWLARTRIPRTHSATAHPADHDIRPVNEPTRG
jgi:hypothetical protein